MGRDGERHQGSEWGVKRISCVEHREMISKDCRSSQQQENILALHGGRVAQVPLSSSLAILQDKHRNSKEMRHLKPLPAGGGLGAGWCELQPLPPPAAPGAWGWPRLQGLTGALGVFLDWLCPAPAVLCLQLLGYLLQTACACQALIGLPWFVCVS